VGEQRGGLPRCVPGDGEEKEKAEEMGEMEGRGGPGTLVIGERYISEGLAQKRSGAQTPVTEEEREQLDPETRQSPKEKWLSTIERDDKRQAEKEQWVEKAQKKRSLKNRIGKQLDLVRVRGTLDGMPVGFYIAPARLVPERDPEW